MLLEKEATGAWAKWMEFFRLEWVLEKLPILFVLSAFSCCMALTTMVPIGQVPDSMAHVARAAALTRGVIFGSIEDITAPDRNIPPFKYSGVKIDSGLKNTVEGSVDYPKELFDKPAPKLTQDELSAEFNTKWSNKLVFVGCPNSLQYFPIFYIPSAIGLGVGHAIGLSPYMSLVAARILNSIAFIFIGWLALRLAKHGKILIFAGLTFPTTLYLTAGMNQDGLCIAFACLAAAILTRAIQEDDKKVANTLRWIAGGLLAAVIASKPPYMPILILLLLPFGQEFVNRCKKIIICALPGLIWFGILLAFYHVNFLSIKSYHPGAWWNGPQDMRDFKVASDNIHVLMQNPARLWYAFSNTFLSDWLAWLVAMVGEFGNYNLFLPSNWYKIYALAIICMLFSLFLQETKLRLKFMEKGFVLCAVFISIYAVLMSIYVSWANAGDTYTTGFNGRYLLPLVPFLLFAITSRQRISIAGKYAGRYLQLPIIAVVLLNCAIVPMCVMDGFGYGLFTTI